MITRSVHSSSIQNLLSANPVVGIIGARQIGKTTLARQFLKTWDGKSHFFDLEDPRDEAKLADPMIALEGLEGLIILDEVQRTPNIFQTLRVLCDRDPLPARFLVLGSASPELLHQSAETLAGRISYLELGG